MCGREMKFQLRRSCTTTATSVLAARRATVTGLHAHVLNLPFAQAADFPGQQVGGLQAEVQPLADQLQGALAIYEAAHALLQSFGGKTVRLAREQRRQAQHVSRTYRAIGQSAVATVGGSGKPNRAAADDQDTVRRLSLSEQNPAGAATP